MGSVNAAQANAQSSDPHGMGAYADRPLRRRTCLNGKVVYGDAAFMGNGALTPDGAFTLDCAIRDISDGGAKIVLTRRQPLPANLYLIVTKYSVAYHAQIVWAKFPARGLKFTQMYLFGSIIPEDIMFLRTLWLDLCARSGICEP